MAYPGPKFHVSSSDFQSPVTTLLFANSLRSCSSGQRYALPVRNPKVQFPYSQKPPSGRIPRQLNPVPTFTTHFSNTFTRVIRGYNRAKREPRLQTAVTLHTMLVLQRCGVVNPRPNHPLSAVHTRKPSYLSQPDRPPYRDGTGPN
jgi:hypothetical protein